MGTIALYSNFVGRGGVAKPLSNFLKRSSLQNIWIFFFKLEVNFFHTLQELPSHGEDNVLKIFPAYLLTNLDS